jgi:hypothetical protein
MGMGLVWLSSPVQGRRKKNIPFPSSQVRSIIHFRDIGRITFTTKQNNFNRHRIFSLRAKLQTPQFVSRPSYATMKSNRESFQGSKPKSLKFSGFKICNSFPFNKTPQKNRSVFSGFQASEPAAPIATGVQWKWEAIKFS